MALGVVRRGGGLVSQVINQLRRELDRGTWVAGERLPAIPALAASLGVSSPTAREAVVVLARQGWLEVRHGVGTFVAEARSEARLGADADVVRWFRRGEVLELYEARRGLETEAARLAASRRSVDDLAALAAAGTARAEARARGRLSEWAEADLALHRAVFAAAGNEVLRGLFDGLAAAHSEAFQDMALDPGTAEVDTSDEHDALVSAIQAGDPAAATAATLGYLDRCEHGLRALLP